MSETSLIENLKATYPTELINPFGEVLIIPTKAFTRGWEVELERQGYKTYANNYGGEAVFFVRLNKPKNNPASEKPASPAATPIVKGRKHSFWSPEESERLKQLDAEGLSNSEIGKAMGRSKASVAWKKTELGLTQARSKSTAAVAVGAAVPNPVILKDDVVKEYLACVSELYPRYRNVCVLLLKQATGEILREGQG